MGKREIVALFNLSSWCLVMVERLFLAVPQGCLRFVIVVFPDHTHLLFLLLPIFDNLLLSLLNPNNAVLNSINEIFYNFFIKSKSKNKNKLVVVKQYSEGG